MSHREISEATVSRLPLYQRSLVELARAGEATVSSARLAETTGVNSAKVRKDLSQLGTYGVRGVGYDVEYLLRQIGHALGLDAEAPVVIVGMGNLGQALAQYSGFSDRGFSVVALIDNDVAKIGSTVGDHVVRPVDELQVILADHPPAVGVIATPPSAAQEVADLLVDAGVGSILNFAPTIIEVPPHIPLRRVDLATELQILGFYQQREAVGSDND